MEIQLTELSNTVHGKACFKMSYIDTIALTL